MTRSYALLKLLEHGPLTARDLQAITGWGRTETLRVAREVMDAGDVVWVRNKEYALADSLDAVEAGRLGARQVIARAMTTQPNSVFSLGERVAA